MKKFIKTLFILLSMTCNLAHSAAMHDELKQKIDSQTSWPSGVAQKVIPDWQRSILVDPEEDSSPMTASAELNKRRKLYLSSKIRPLAKKGNITSNKGTSSNYLTYKIKSKINIANPVFEEDEFEKANLDALLLILEPKVVLSGTSERQLQYVFAFYSPILNEYFGFQRDKDFFKVLSPQEAKNIYHQYYEPQKTRLSIEKYNSLKNEMDNDLLIALNDDSLSEQYKNQYSKSIINLLDVIEHYLVESDRNFEFALHQIRDERIHWALQLYNDLFGDPELPNTPQHLKLEFVEETKKIQEIKDKETQAKIEQARKEQDIEIQNEIAKIEQEEIEKERQAAQCCVIL